MQWAGVSLLPPLGVRGWGAGRGAAGLGCIAVGCGEGR